MYVYKTELINPSQRGSQLVSSALQERTLFPQEVNQNVMDVVNAPVAARNENIAVEAQAAKRNRGRPPKNSTQEAASNGQASQAPTFTQPDKKNRNILIKSFD